MTVLCELRVDGLPERLGCADRALRFSWRGEDAGRERAVRQEWWSVVVTTRRPGGGDHVVWDSGRQHGSDPWALSPADLRFAAWTEHRWLVTVGLETVRGETAEHSASSWFVPAPASEADWAGATWIGAREHDPEALGSIRAHSGDGGFSAPVLERRIEAGGGIARVTIALAAGGHVDVRVDDEPATREVLSPGVTHWDRRVEVVMHDLTDAFRSPGPHTVGLLLGRGFFGITNANVWAWERAPWHGPPRVRAALRVEHADGTVEMWATDAAWLTRPSEILLDDPYGGEVVDLRRRAGGRLAPPTRPAEVVTAPGGALEPRREQSIRVVDDLLPESIVPRGEGEWVLSYPRVIAGWVRLRLPGDSAGAIVRIRYGERLRADGLPNADDDNGYFADGFQTDLVTLDDGPAVWEPRFSYKGFRYVQLSGWPGPAIAPDDAVARVVRTDASRLTQLELADPLLQWEHDAAVSTIENNLHGYPTDTPKYEKNGWTGDAALGAEMMLTELDAAPLLEKWVTDLVETMRPGHPPDLIAPNAGVFGVDEQAPPWQSALVTVPWDVYRHTGDDRILRRNAEAIEAYARLEFERSPGGIADTILGDWVAPGTDPGGGNPVEDSRIPATAFLIRALDTTAAIAGAIGRDDAWFREAAEIARAAFSRAFIASDDAVGHGVVTGEGDDGFRQSHHVLALAFDVVRDPAVRHRIADALAADVRLRGDHLDTGALGTRWLLPVLTENGHRDLAMAIARQRTPPSWGAWYEAGATSMLEHWNLGARSHGHYFLGTVDSWLTQYVAGLRIVSPGWRSFLVAPCFTDVLGAASCRTRTPYGVVDVRWERHGADETVIEVSVPTGAEAHVAPPDGTHRTLGPGEHRLVSGREPAVR